MIRTGKKPWKLMLKWGGAIGILGLAIYPIIISPMYDPTSYKNIQKMSRKDIDQDKIQPGNLKVWSDPFNRKKPND